MKLRAFTLPLLAVAALGLSACGSDDDAKDTTDKVEQQGKDLQDRAKQIEDKAQDAGQELENRAKDAQGSAQEASKALQDRAKDVQAKIADLNAKVRNGEISAADARKKTEELAGGLRDEAQKRATQALDTIEKNNDLPAEAKKQLDEARKKLDELQK